MREATALFGYAISVSHSVRTTISAFYDGELVLDEIPVIDGERTADVEQLVPESATITVPRYLNHPETGEPIDLLPVTETDPLNCCGQQVSLTQTVGLSSGREESVDLGWLRIQAWSEEAGAITLECVGLLSLIEEARFLSPGQVAVGTTFAAAAELMVGDLLPTNITADPARVASARAYEDDRLAALASLVVAWPARMSVDTAGVLQIAPPFDDATDTPVGRLTDGVDGTVVQVPRSGSRDGVYNAVKASGEGSGDVEPVSATAYLQAGPRAWNGPFGNVPYFYTSPLLTTRSQALAAARTRLQNLQRLVKPVNIEIVPDARYEVGDVLELVTDDGKRFVRVDASTLPLTYAGTQTLRCHELEVISS